MPLMQEALPTMQKASRLLSEAWSLYGQKYVPPTAVTATAVGVGVGAGALALPDEAEAGKLPPLELVGKPLRRAILKLKKVYGETGERPTGEMLELLYDKWKVEQGLPSRGPELEQAFRRRRDKEELQATEDLSKRLGWIEELKPLQKLTPKVGSKPEPPLPFTPLTPNSFREFERELDYLYDQVTTFDLSPLDDELATRVMKAVEEKSKQKLASLLHELPTKYKGAEYSEELQSAIKWFLGGVAGVTTVGGLLSPKEAEASPAGRVTGHVTGEAWKKLVEEAWPIAKDMTERHGPVEYDFMRKWWSRRITPFSFRPEKDTDAFLKFIDPYLERAKQVDPPAYANTMKWIEMAKKEEQPKYLEYALINLHRVIAHDSPAARKIEELMLEYPPSEIRKAILKHIPDTEMREKTNSLLLRWTALGLGGAATLGSLLSPDEAEAGVKPPTRLFKSIIKKVGGLSSASWSLKGMELMGKTVKEVRKGVEPWRYVVFEDGTYSVMNKKYLASLASAEGEKGYTRMFDLSKKPHQTYMIRRSFALKQAKKTPPEELAKGLESRADLLSELGEKTPKRWTFKVGGKSLTLPTSYGQFLKKYGEPSTKLRGRTPVEKALNVLEESRKMRELSSAEEYMLSRFKGKSVEEASKGLTKLNVDAIERMVQKIMGALR